jgi:Protein of unknown function (DUF2905)
LTPRARICLGRRPYSGGLRVPAVTITVGNKPLGQLIIVLGLTIIVIGILTVRGWLGWLGHLPGDVRVERENVRVYVPIVSVLLISLLLSVLSYVLRRIF